MYRIGENSLLFVSSRINKEMFFSSHMFLYTLFSLLIFVVFLLKWLSTAISTAPKKLPPSPSKRLIIGNLHQLGSYPHRSLQSLARKYGPLMLLHFGSKPVLIISSASAAREIMKTHDLTFSNRPKSTIASKLLYNSKDIAFAPYGEYWRQIRSISVLHLLNNKRIKSFRSVREEETKLVIKKLEGSCSSSSSSSSSSASEVNLSEILIQLTNDVACRIALGRKYDRDGRERERQFKELLKEFGFFLGIFDVGDYIAWLRWVNKLNGLYNRVDNLARELDQFLEGVVEEHMNEQRREKNGYGEGKAGEDFVDVLLEMQREENAGIHIDRDTIKALVLDVFAAGTDTTSTVLEWVMAELLRHPKIMQQLQNEVREMAIGKSTISEQDLDKLLYLKAVIKETMRLHPPIPLLVPRESTQDVEVMGYKVSIGTQVITNVWAIGRDPESWEDPEDFRPERFLDSNIDFKGHDFQLIPFGAGRRVCPGIQLAMKLDELALANLLLKFDFSLPGEAKGEDLDMSEASGISIHKKLPLLTIITPYSC